MKLHKPFNPDGDTLTTTSKIGDILDKGNFKSNFQNLNLKKLIENHLKIKIFSGKHMVFSTDYETRDSDGDLVCSNQFVTFVRNQGGFGGTNKIETIVAPIDAPDREPNHVVEEMVPLGQARVHICK